MLITARLCQRLLPVQITDVDHVGMTSRPANERQMKRRPETPADTTFARLVRDQAPLLCDSPKSHGIRRPSLWWIARVRMRRLTWIAHGSPTRHPPRIITPAVIPDRITRQRPTVRPASATLAQQWAAVRPPLRVFSGGSVPPSL